MRVLIFGGNGQDGYYFKRYATSVGCQVLITSRTVIDPSNIVCDVTNYSQVHETIKKYQPDIILNFAANSSTRHDLLFNHNSVICVGTLNILESVRLIKPSAKVFLSGSGLQFQNNDKPISELNPLHSSSTYSIARIQSLYTARYFREKFGLRVYFGFLFNHDSPKRELKHINQKIIKDVQLISRGELDHILIGNVNVKKEFSFAGDIVRAIWYFVNQDKINEMVIGSGVAFPISEWLHICFSKYGLDWTQFVKTDQSFKQEYNVLVSDPALLYGLGWSPKVDIHGLAKLMDENDDLYF